MDGNGNGKYALRCAVSWLPGHPAPSSLVRALPGAIVHQRGLTGVMMARFGAAHPNPSGFFDELSAQRQPLLRNMSGTLRFDVLHGDETEYWYLTIAQGDVAVTREAAPADSVIRLREDLFDDIVSGRANAMAALMRGELGVEGNGELLMRLQRTFPGPQGHTR